MKINFKYINKTSWLLTILMFAFALISTPYLPSQIPYVLNSNEGIIDTTNKLIIFMFPLIASMIIIIGNVVPIVDPKRRSYYNTKKEYNLICSISILSLFIIQSYIILLAKNLVIFPSKFNLISMITGAIIIISGNYLPKFSFNYLTGVKTIWAYSSEDIWRKTQRLASKLWICCGFIIILCSIFFNENQGYINTIIILIMIIVPRIYGMNEYRKNNK